jgi:hypothetical protein
MADTLLGVRLFADSVHNFMKLNMNFLTPLETSNIFKSNVYLLRLEQLSFGRFARRRAVISTHPRYLFTDICRLS